MKPDASGLVVATKSNNSSSTGTEAGAELLRRGSLEWWGLPLPEQVPPCSCLPAILQPQGFPDGALHTALSSSKPGEEPLELKLPSGWWGSSPPPRTGPQTGQLQRGLFGPLRRSVSCSRNRYEWNGFDLDLTYVTSRIIAMGIPGKGLAATYRNPVTEVDRFLRWAHGDSFRIYNLCAEEKHAANGFPGQTVRYPFFDHCPPPLQMMLDFCRDVEAWLRSGEENVAVVHCKAGKGRCGTMACALLVFSGAMPSAYEALRWFARVRGGGKRSGVTIPSQIRWIAMFEHWLRSGAGPCALGWPGAPEAAPARGAGRAPAPPPEAHRYRLRTLRLGPIRQALLRPCAGGAGRGETAVLIGIAPREAVTKKRKDLWHWYPEAIIQTVNEGHLEVAFPSGGPLLEESDGVLKVRVRRPQSSTASASRLRGALFRRPPTLEVSTWWSFEFLQPLDERGGSSLHLDLPKAYVDGMQGDMRRHKLAPPDFRLRLTTVEERPRRLVGPYGRGGSTSFDATKNIDGAAPRLPLSQQSARRAAAAGGGAKPSIRFESVLQKGACGLLGCFLGASAHKELTPRSP